MGYAVPQVGYKGYCASDTTLYNDSTEYTSQSLVYELVLTGYYTSDLRKYSTLRFKCEFKQQQNGNQAWGKLVDITNNETLATWEDLVGGAYINQSEDFDISENTRGNTLGIYLKSDSALPTRKAMIRNIEICGTETPIIFE